MTPRNRNILIAVGAIILVAVAIYMYGGFNTTTPAPPAAPVTTPAPTQK
jgi:hypothetical protein